MNPTSTFTLWMGLILTQPTLAAVRSTADRISAREYPSVFQAWNPAEHTDPKLDPKSIVARHDLFFHAPEAFGLIWNSKFTGLAKGFKSNSIKKGLRYRAELLKYNPNLILLAEIRYRDAPSTYLPDDSPYWKRNEKGEKLLGWKEGEFFLLDFSNETFQDMISAQCAAAVKTGVVDGCMLDWWSSENSDKFALIKKVRKAIGDQTLMMVNVNGKQPTKAAPYINGVFMEGFDSDFFKDWKVAVENLCWMEKNLHKPTFTALEGWGLRKDFAQMRMVTAMSLTQSNGYVLFGDPNPLPGPDHLHDWYPFWDKSLGVPKEEACKGKKNDGSYSREFEKGTVIFNPPGNPPVKVVFDQIRTSKATGLFSKTATVLPADGDIFLK